MTLRLHHLTFTHANSSTPLFEDLSLHVSAGWTGLIGPNGSGKTSLLELAAGVLKADSGSVEREGFPVFCAQRTDAPPDDQRSFAEAVDAEASRLRRLLHIESDWHERWESLSHGERKRLQIAVALWKNPDILLIDEPTNHLDRDSLDFLHQALHGFTGTGILVTHDRHLLDSLCQVCIFLEPGGIRRYPGSYTQAREQKQRDEVSV
ncbi:MAG TPA: ATP-binding cassette domain-containing protein, partial [Candidatus Ozemobacteraceae bacterium]|nr:ATP-binding cassette domain-containing protein [Candidatus Ozemobacteraceae bacterium]